MKWIDADQWAKDHGIDINDAEYPDKMAESHKDWANFSTGNTGDEYDLANTLEELEKLYPGLEFEMMENYGPYRGPVRIMKFPSPGDAKAPEQLPRTIDSVLFQK